MNRNNNAPAAVPAGAETAHAPTLTQWFAVLLLSITAFLMVTVELLPVGLLPTIASDIKTTSGEAGLMITITGIMAAIGAPVVSILAGRTDRRIVVMALSALLVVSSLVAALAWSFSAILLARIMVGIAIGGFWTIGVTIGPRLFPDPTGTRGATIVFAGISLGTIAGVPAGTFIGNLAGWRWAFGAAAIASALLVIAQFLSVPPLPVKRSTRWSDLSAVLPVPRVRLGLILALLALVGQFFAYTYIAPFLGQVAGIKAAGIGALLLLMGVAGFFGNMLGGWTAGRDVRQAKVGTALVIATSVLLLALVGSNAYAASALIGIWGLGFGALPIVMQTWMMRAAPEAEEASAVLFVSTAQIAIASGSVIGGMIVDRLGVTSAMAMGGIIVAAAAFVAWMFGHENRALCDQME